ncbi:MAG: MATE family efflux transporter [Deltaproteobacteria bacterium]|nr:MATE family efflux transporter [Deltaproteobacteria bacterium]
MLSYSVMTLASTLFVGQLGAGTLAGVGLGGTVAFAVLCFSIGLLRAVKVVVSQAIGAGRRDEAIAFTGAGLWTALALGAATIAVGEAVASALPLLTASEEAGRAASDYLRIRVLGAPIVLVFVALREARYGDGDSRSPMVASVLANLANVGFLWIGVGMLGWGAAGAAAATLAAHVLEAGVLLWLTPRRLLGWSKPTWEHVWSVARVGMPTGLQFLLEVGSFTLLAAMISRLSEVEMAAHQIALNVIHFSFLPAFAVAEAASVLAGQAVGANRDELVRVVARKALLAASAYTGICTLVLGIAASEIASAFTGEPVLHQATVHLLWVAALFQVADGANVVARGALRGTGDVKYPAVVGVLTAWAMTPPLTWLLGYRAGLGALGGWIGLCAEIVLGTVLVWWRLERGAWRDHAVRSRREVARQQAEASPAAVAS